jgi:hypothetical protein
LRWLLVIFAAVSWWGFSHSLPYAVLALLPVLWAVLPPHNYPLPRQSFRVARLCISLVLIYVTLLFWVWALYRWDHDSWGITAGTALLIGALFAYSRFRRWADLPDKQINSIEEVVRREADWLRIRRAALGLPQPVISSASRPDDSNLVGLALSGGGIRSATVCLGFVSELARNGLFQQFDYLSTVSGGGWFGSALTATAAKCSSEENAAGLIGPAEFELIRQSFRSNRDYLGRAKIVRALVVMLSGTVISFLTLTFFVYGWIMFLLWLSTFRMDNWMTVGANAYQKADEYIREHIGPQWLYRAPRAEHLYDLIEPLRLFPALLLISTFVLCCAGLIKLLSLKSAAGRLREMADGALMVSTRLFIVVAVLDCALQGRQILTAALCVFAVMFILQATGRPKANLQRLLLSLLIGLTPWAADLLIPRWQIVEKLTSLWYYAFIRAIFSPFNLLQFFTMKAYILVGYAGTAPPELDTVTGTSLGLSDKAALLLFFGGGLAAWLLFFLAGYLFQRNRTGLNSFWAAQIDDAFLSPMGGTATRLPLASLRHEAKHDGIAAGSSESKGPGRGAPLQIINAAVNLPGSPDENVRRRGVERFEMTPYCVGGPATGWVDATLYGKRITLASATAISAAAINPQSGHKIPGLYNWLLLLSNLRLGVWFPNPRMASDPRRFNSDRSFAPLDLLREFLGTNGEEDTQFSSLMAGTATISAWFHSSNGAAVVLLSLTLRLIHSGNSPTWSTRLPYLLLTGGKGAARIINRSARVSLGMEQKTASPRKPF